MQKTDCRRCGYECIFGFVEIAPISARKFVQFYPIKIFAV